MADIVESAVGEITVRDNTGAGVASATANFNKLYDSIRYNWWGIQNLGRSFAAVGGIIAAGLGAATKASIDFEQGMAQVARTGNLQGKEINAMSDALRQMALVKPLDITQLTGIAAAAGQLGIVGAENIEKFTGVIADLTQTTNLTAGSAERLAKMAGPLNIVGDDWERLGSTILTLGIHTAASETEIVNTAIQLTSLGAIAHATAPEIFALAAEINSVSKEASSGATGIQRFVGQIATMASGATPKAAAQFKLFASIVGETSDKVRKSFNFDAIPVVGDFVTGLAKMRLSTQDFTKVLEELGISEQRERRILAQMVGAVNQTGQPILQINNILKAGNEAWAKNTELQSQTQKMYATTAAQLKLTENTVKDIAIAFGGDLAGAVNKALVPIDNFLRGIDALPAPMKTFITYGGLTVAGLSLMAAAAASIVPRMVLIGTSLRAVAEGFAENTAYANRLVYALRQQAIAAGESADIGVLSATKLTKAEQTKALAVQQATNATRIKAAAAESAAYAENERIIAAERFAAAETESARASDFASRADEKRALAAELSAKGMNTEAASAGRSAGGLASQARAAEASAEANIAAGVAAEDAALGFDSEAVAAARAEAGLVAEETAAIGATGATFGLATAFNSLGGWVGIAFAAITALVVGLGIYGSVTRDNAEDTRILGEYNADLAAAITQAGNASAGTLAVYYANSQAFNELSASIGGAISSLQLFTAISGGAGSDKALRDTLDELHQRYLQGDKDAAKQAQNLVQQHNDQVATIKYMNAQIRTHRQLGVANKSQAAAEKGVADATKSATAASQKETQALQKEAQAHDRINQATLDYPHAILAVEQAQTEATAAQKAYNDALADGNTKQRDIEKATDDLVAARYREAQAVEKVKQAQDDLARARQNEIDAVAEAQDRLASDTDRLADDQQAILAAQLKLTEDQASDGMLDLTKAVNALNDAYDRLHESSMSVADAQYNLNYLLAEGASARDIADAQQALTEAQHGHADALTGVSDAQNGVLEAQANSGPAKLAQDQRDLAEAIRQVSEDNRQLTQDTYSLQDAQENLANDTGVLDAEAALAEAEGDLHSAQQEVIDSTQALKDARQETGAEAMEAAEQSLESALLNLASAHVQVTKDLAEMEGKQFGAGKQAQALADELTKLGLTAAGPVRNNINKMAEAIRNAAVTDIRVPTASSAPAGGGGGGGIGGGGAVGGGPQHTIKPGHEFQSPFPEQQKGGEAAKGLMSSFINWFKDGTHIKQIAVAILTGLAAALVIAFAPVELSALAVGAVAALIVAFSAYIIDKFGPKIVDALKEAWGWVADHFKAAWGWLKDEFNNLIDWIGGFFKEHWDEILVILTGPIGLAVKEIKDHWGDIKDAFASVFNWIKDKWDGIKDFLTKPVEAAATWIKNHFDDVVDAFKKPFEWVGEHWSNIKDKITNPLENAVGWIRDHFDNVTDILKRPFEWVRDHWSDIKDKLTNPLGNAVDWIHTKFDNVVNFFSNLPGRIAHALAGLGDGIIYPFKYAWHYIATLWNDSLGHLRFSVPGWVPFIGGHGWGFPQIQNVPQLAEGGVTTKPTLAMIGEGGQNEAIIPLDQFAHIFAPVDHLAMQMAATNSALETLLSSLPGVGGSSEGDTFYITEALADPMQIAEDIIFKKKVRLR